MRGRGPNTKILLSERRNTIKSWYFKLNASLGEIIWQHINLVSDLAKETVLDLDLPPHSSSGRYRIYQLCHCEIINGGFSDLIKLPGCSCESEEEEEWLRLTRLWFLLRFGFIIFNSLSFSTLIPDLSEAFQYVNSLSQKYKEDWVWSPFKET